MRVHLGMEGGGGSGGIGHAEALWREEHGIFKEQRKGVSWSVADRDQI